MRYYIFMIMLLFLWSCITYKIYPRSPLADQILRVRADYPGKLTNTACLEYDKNGHCNIFDTVSYDLNDPVFRNKINAFNFVCKVAGKRFRICRDKPGYCRKELTCAKHGFLGIGCKRYDETYLPASDHKYLVDATVVCSKKEL